MSLRGRLLAAFAYVLVLVLVALAVPLAINLSRRVNVEVEGQASNQALLVAASAADRLGSRGDLDEIVGRAATDLSGRSCSMRAADCSPTRPARAWSAIRIAPGRRFAPRCPARRSRGGAAASLCVRTCSTRRCRSCGPDRPSAPFG